MPMQGGGISSVPLQSDPDAIDKQQPWLEFED
jgi:hypothetical protein